MHAAIHSYQSLILLYFYQYLNTPYLTTHLPNSKNILKKTDKTLLRWEIYLIAACKWLNSIKIYEPLIELQLFMDDYSRAGRTCIRMFIECNSQDERLGHLERAKKFFEKGLSFTPGDVIVKDPIPDNEINNNLKTIKLQLDISNCFIDKQTNLSDDVPNDLTVFGNHSQKSTLAELLFVLSSTDSVCFDLSYRVIQEFRLPMVPIYLNAFSRIVRKKLPIKKIIPLIESVNMTLNNNDDFDQIISTMISIYVNEIKERKPAELLITYLTGTVAKVNAYLLCLLFKNAYTEATNAEDIELVRKVKDCAREHNVGTVILLCDEFLKSRR